MARIRTYLLFAAKVAISLVLLHVAFRSVNFDVLRERFGELNYGWIAVALVALGIQIGLVSLRWQRIADCCGAHLIFRRAALYYLIGSFFSQVLPSTIGGDAARIRLGTGSFAAGSRQLFEAQCREQKLIRCGSRSAAGVARARRRRLPLCRA